MRKVKSWLRWAKKRYEEKYGIKITSMQFPKEQLKMIQKVRHKERFFKVVQGGKHLKINLRRLRNDI